MTNPSFLLVASFPDSLIRFRGHLIQALVRQNLQVHVAAPDLGPTSATRLSLEKLGVQVHSISLRRTGTNPLHDLGCLWSLWRLQRKIRPTYVLAYTIKPVIYGSIAAYLARIPQRYALITGLGYAFQATSGAGWKSKILLKAICGLYALALNSVDGIFFQNRDDAALFHLRKILGPNARTIVVNGSGVDIAEFAVAPLPPQISFLLIARLLGDKGVREYVQAARKIRQQDPSIVFNLVGWIDENPNAVNRAELDGWVSEGVITYLGRLEDVRPAITACSIYVLPSYREGTPRTVLEAMAMGRPIITTDAPGCRETVIEGENGFLVPPRSVDELTVAMAKLIDNPGLIERMGRRSREIAEQKYDVHKVNAVMLNEMGLMEHEAS